MRSQEEWSNLVEKLLAELEINGAVIGGVAAMKYRATERLTKDVDFLVRDFGKLKLALESGGFEVREMRDPTGSIFLLRANRDDESVDIQLAETEYQSEALSRSRDGYLSPEDIIIHKLIAWRDRDRDDIESILVAGHKLDIEYIEHWASEWEVTDRWAEALSHTS